MQKSLRTLFALAFMMLNCQFAIAQVYDINEFDETATGPWSDIANTTLVVPRVADGGVKLDGTLSSAEYGGFAKRTITPGDNAWILSFAQNKNWEGPEDSAFAFWLAHDTNFLYVGVDVKDEDVVSNNSNAEFWKDDAIEIIVDANNDRVNFNTDEQANELNAYGGHNYVNYEGRFSRWDEDTMESLDGWANDDTWTYGPEGEIFGKGGKTATGWSMEAKFHKSQFQDPATGNKLENNYKMGFNIGMDDDDGADLDIQYWWANRERPVDFTYDAFLEGQTINDFLPKDDTWVIDANGRLTHGGAGEIIFGGFTGPAGDYNGSGALDAGDLDVHAQYVKDKNLSGDVDGDGDTDGTDRVAWVHTLQKSWLGDSNFDGEFSSADFVKVFTDGKYETGQPAGYAQGDWNGDMVFSSGDFVAAFTDGGYERGPRPATAAVPEPSSFALLLSLGVLGLPSRKCRCG